MRWLCLQIFVFCVWPILQCVMGYLCKGRGRCDGGHSSGVGVRLCPHRNGADCLFCLYCPELLPRWLGRTHAGPSSETLSGTLMLSISLRGSWAFFPPYFLTRHKYVALQGFCFGLKTYLKNIWYHRISITHLSEEALSLHSWNALFIYVYLKLEFCFLSARQHRRYLKRQ